MKILIKLLMLFYLIFFSSSSLMQAVKKMNKRIKTILPGDDKDKKQSSVSQSEPLYKHTPTGPQIKLSPPASASKGQISPTSDVNIKIPDYGNSVYYIINALQWDLKSKSSHDQYFDLGVPIEKEIKFHDKLSLNYIVEKLNDDLKKNHEDFYIIKYPEELEIYAFKKYVRDWVPKLRHEFLMICAYGGAGNEYYFVVDRGGQGLDIRPTDPVTGLFSINTKIRYIYTSKMNHPLFSKEKHEICDLNSENWLENKDNMRSQGYAKDSVKASFRDPDKIKYKMSNFINATINYAIHNPTYNATENCQHFATGMYNAMIPPTEPKTVPDVLENTLNIKSFTCDWGVYFGPKSSKSSKSRKILKKFK